MNIWNCFHGCKKYSDGCKNCYMYYLDKSHGLNDSNNIYKVKTQFDFPLKTVYGKYKIKSGDEIQVGLNTDFFITKEESGVDNIDEWRNEVWNIVKMRPDVKFIFLTKRAFNINNCLPDDWGNGYENVRLGLTIENQKAADERIKTFLDVKAKHKYIFCAPLLSSINLNEVLSSGQIELVMCGGENYGKNTRICKYEWVKNISEQCKKYNITFSFIETGTRWVDKDNNLIIMPSKIVESKEAYRTNLSFLGKETKWNLSNIDENNKYEKWFAPWCKECGSLYSCNGCNLCGKCKRRLEDYE